MEYPCYLMPKPWGGVSYTASRAALVGTFQLAESLCAAKQGGGRGDTAAYGKALLVGKPCEGTLVYWRASSRGGEGMGQNHRSS